MAVYTELNKRMIQSVLEEYALGELIAFSPVYAGIENTNYFLSTVDPSASQPAAEWVLTIFENIEITELSFFNQLTTYLAQQDFHVPAPIANQQGKLVFQIAANGLSKFGVIVPKFKGASLLKPDLSACSSIAQYVAKMHLALTKYPRQKNIEHTVDWCRNLLVQLAPRLCLDDKTLIELALARYVDYESALSQCASGIVHGDLFKDNVLFENADISGVIDFYHAGSTAFLFDLAVIANDWAINEDQLPALCSNRNSAFASSSEGAASKSIYNEQKLAALISAYDAVRLLSEQEKKLWPRFLELAAFRFWLSRLKTQYLAGYQQEVKEGDALKSPDAMKLILRSAMQRS